MYFLIIKVRNKVIDETEFDQRNYLKVTERP